MDLIPNIKSIETIHMVPVISNIEEEPDMERASQWISLPPRKYASIF